MELKDLYVLAEKELDADKVGWNFIDFIFLSLWHTLYV